MLGNLLLNWLIHLTTFGELRWASWFHLLLFFMLSFNTPHVVCPDMLMVPLEHQIRYGGEDVLCS